MTDNTTGQSSIRLSVVAIGVVIWMAGFLPLFMPGARMWGFNHLIFVDRLFTCLYIVAGLAAVLLFIPTLNKTAEKWLSGLASLFNNAPGYSKWALLSLLAIPVFWLLRMPINFLGDGYTLINNVGNDLPVILKWSEVGSISLVYALYQILPQTGIEGAQSAYAIISVLSGGITLFFFCALAHELAENKIGRFFIFALLVLSGWTLLFLGYAENYPILWPFITGYIYFSLRYLKGRGSLVLPTILLAVAIALHLLVIFFSLSYLILLFKRGAGARLYKNHRKYVWTAAGLMAAIGFYVFISQYYRSLEFKLHFIPLLTGRPGAPGYTLLSGVHLLDILNEARLVMPLWPALMLLGWSNWTRRRKDSLDFFLFLFSAGGLGFLFFIDPRLGMGRDWDLFALCCLGPMLILLRETASAGKKISGHYPGLVVLSLVLVMPYFAVNIGYLTSIDYFHSLLRQDISRSKAGLSQLRNYYRDLGDDQSADNLQQEIIDTYPFLRLADRAMELAEAGQNQRARRLADSLFAANPYSVESYNVRGLVYLKTGRYAAAIRDLEKAAEMGLYDASILTNLANAYFQIGRYDLMMEKLRQGQKYDQDNPGVSSGLAAAFFRSGDYDSTLIYADKIIRSDSLQSEIYRIAGISAARLNLSIQAENYLGRYLELSPDGPGRKQAEEILESLKQTID